MISPQQVVVSYLREIPLGKETGFFCVLKETTDLEEKTSQTVNLQ